MFATLRNYCSSTLHNSSDTCCAVNFCVAGHYISKTIPFCQNSVCRLTAFYK